VNEPRKEQFFWVPENNNLAQGR